MTILMMQILAFQTGIEKGPDGPDQAIDVSRSM